MWRQHCCPNTVPVERCARGVHLGVMVGFAVVAPHFNPNDQNEQTMQTMCKWQSFSPRRPTLQLTRLQP